MYDIRRFFNHSKLSKRFEWIDDEIQSGDTERGVEEPTTDNRLEGQRIIHNACSRSVN